MSVNLTRVETEGGPRLHEESIYPTSRQKTLFLRYGDEWRVLFLGRLGHRGPFHPREQVVKIANHGIGQLLHAE